MTNTKTELQKQVIKLNENDTFTMLEIIQSEFENHLQGKNYPDYDINFYIDTEQNKVGDIEFLGHIAYLDDLMKRIGKDGLNIELYNELMKYGYIEVNLYDKRNLGLTPGVGIEVYELEDIEIIYNHLQDIGLEIESVQGVYDIMNKMQEKILRDVYKITEQLENIGNDILKSE